MKKAEKPAESHADKAKANFDRAEQAEMATPRETWNEHWTVARRLLELRRKLRGTKLWKTFELQRSFEAFSIHLLADEIEAVATECGLISSFRTTKWDKLGNKTVVEGMATFEDVDHGEIREYIGIGEAIDNGDKGLHKANSDARKVALICALNLGIGNDKEVAADKFEGDPAHNGSMGGSPQQSTQSTQSQPAQANGNGATHTKDTETYTLEQRGLKARAVLGRDLPQTVWTIVMNSPTAGAIDELIKMNKAEFDRFFENDNARGEELNAIISTKRAGLVAAGRV